MELTLIFYFIALVICIIVIVDCVGLRIQTGRGYVISKVVTEHVFDGMFIPEHRIKIRVSTSNPVHHGKTVWYNITKSQYHKLQEWDQVFIHYTVSRLFNRIQIEEISKV